MLQPHQQRVADEQQELKTKLDKLEGFIVSLYFLPLSAAEQSRLKRQFLIMTLYNDVLLERLAEFK